jgi:hypothetical protein
MSELSDESKALIESEGPLDEASPAEIEAMHVRVVALLAGVPAPVAGPDPTPLAGKAAAATSLKVVGTAIAAAVGSSALLFALSQPSSPTLPSASPRASVTAPAPVAAPAIAPSETAAAEPAPSAAPLATPVLRPNKPSAPAPSAAPAPTASEEALLVAAAEAQLRAGHPAAALALYEQHLREYPRGALRQESQNGRIIALCGVGRTAEARADIERFAVKHAGSASLLRMQRACGIEP